MQQSLDVNMNGLEPYFPYSKQELTLFFVNILRYMNMENASLELELTQDKDMCELNFMHMACVGPTNILSFPSGEDKFLGSLVLSVDTLEREARLYEQERKSYAKGLLIHGFAHLLGYEHGQDMDRLCETVLKGVAYGI